MTGKSIEDKLESIFKNYKPVKLPKGNTIIQPDEIPNYIYYLTNGYIRSYTITEDGNELTINIFKPQTFFPMATILADRKNIYYYEALTDSTLHKAHKEEILDKLLNDKIIMKDLLRRISIGIEGLLLRMQFLVRSEAKQKIASTLVMLSRRFGMSVAPNQIKITLPLTHQDIANLIGSARETASIELKKLEKKGIAERMKKMTLIKNFSALQEEAMLYEDGQPLPFAF